MSTSTPLIVIVDLDGTLIGDITPQIMTFDLAKNFKLAGYKFHHDLSDLRSKLKAGLVRPFFDTFMKSLSQYLPVEFFIYTASEKSWAELVIKNIEAIYKIKFNRPIFARQYCVFSEKDREYKKSLGAIRPFILKFLKKKYGVPFTKQDLHNRVIVIDNTNVYHQNDQKNLLLCPTYNYRVSENIAANVKHDFYKTHYLLINNTLRKYMHLTTSSDYNIFQKEFYTYYLTYIDTQMKHNARYIQDKFWLYLKDIIITHGIRKFDETSIRYIYASLRSKLGSSLSIRNDRKSHRTQSFF